MSDTTQPQAWIGCLACYSAGELVGLWVDGDEAGETTVEIVHMRSEIVTPSAGWETHEELWVFDHEGYGGLIDGECSPAEAQRVAELFERVPERDREALIAYIEYTGSADDADTFDDAYAGQWGSVEEYAESFAEDIGAIDLGAAWPLSHIDWEAAARDLTTGGDIFTVDAPGGVFVFRAV